jgi:hypothetical protein
MNIEIIKNKILSLPLVSELPSDEELEKFINLSDIIIKLYFTLPSEFISSEEYTTVIALEAAHLIENTPYEDVYKQYNYLSSFNVAGAIQGTVAEKYTAYVSPIVENFMKRLGYFMEISNR